MRAAFICCIKKICCRLPVRASVTATTISIETISSFFLGETSVWSLNATSADLFLKRSAIENIRQQFTNQNIRYSVLINNVQTEIDAGNQKPPNDPGYQNRSGKISDFV